jgi:hypothetical protein
MPVYNTIYTVINNPKNTTPRMVNLGGYGTGYNNSNATISPKTAYMSQRPSRTTYNNSNNRSSKLGNVLGKIFLPGNNSYNNSQSSSSDNNRTYSPSSSSNKSSSTPSSGGSGGTISRPVRNGKG